MEHWTETIEHDSITDENREAFKTANAKYATEADAIVGGYNAQKLAGKPYKVPDDLSKLDDTSKAEFTSQASKLLGIEYAKDLDGLKDLDLKVGQADGAATDETLATAFKQFVVDNKVNKADAQKMLGFYNTAMGQATEAYKQKAEDDKIAKMEACNKALIAHPDIGSEEKLNEQTELFKRAIMNNCGLSAEEAKTFADDIANSMFTTTPTTARLLLKAFAPLAAEGSTGDGGGGGGSTGTVKQQTPYEAKKSNWPKSPSMWGKPEDTWDMQSLQTKKALGYKTPA